MGGTGRTIVSDDEEEIEYHHEEEEDDEDEDEGEGENLENESMGDDDDEDEEGLDEYEKNDGFLNDDDDDDEEEPEEEESDQDNEERHRKKKRKQREKFALDDDDILLLQDNDVHVAPQKASGNKKFKRLKKGGGDADVGRSAYNGITENDESGGLGRTAEERVKRSLWDDDGDLIEDLPEENEPIEEDDEGLGDDDDLDDFIVSDEEIDETGGLVRRRKVKKKNKRHGQAPGFLSSSMQEAYETFGNVEETLQMRRKILKTAVDSGVSTESKLEDQFEPIILSERYMTDIDDRIREIDIPERMQISEQSTVPPKAYAIESEWIVKQLDSGLVSGFVKITRGDQERAELEDHIKKFLNFTHVQKFDVPFIAMYRKEDIFSLLKDPEGDDNVNHDKPSLKWHKLLWAVHDLDKKWLLLQKRKSALTAYYNKRFDEECQTIDDLPRLSLNQQLFKSIMEGLTKAESERDVDDVDLKFNLNFPPVNSGVGEGKYKRPMRKSLYSICSKAGLWEATNKFGCTSKQFGDQISLQSTGVEEPEDPKDTPEAVASNFTCAMFNSPQDVLKGARHMASCEISCEPVVRKHFRSIYFDNAVVSTCPTLEGDSVIDPFHRLAGVKWLREKPLSKFEDAQWLLIQKAEEEKLLRVSIKLPEDVLQKLVNDSHDKYLSCGVSTSAQMWNEQRKLILQDAIFNSLLPAMEKEARLYLSSRAKNYVLMDYGKQLWNKVSVAPYQRKDSESSSEDEAAPRVMACCWGPGKPPTTFVMLDSFGDIVDVLEAGSISLRSQNATDQERKKNDQQKLLKFMTDHQPQVVVLGAVNLSCTRLKDDIYEIVFKMVEENPRDVGHEMDGLSVCYGDEALPRLYENSRISAVQLPGKQGIVKQAVALGRYIQNPLAMVATLCGPGRDILSWKLSPLEDFVTSDEKYAMVEQIMVDVTNQVGLDLNLAANHEWLFAPLQFISGLGPRKAAFLQRSLIRIGTIATRKDLLTTHGLAKNVFINASGFLRVGRSGLANNANQFVDVLEDTRIHPESYALAQEMVKVVHEEMYGDDEVDVDEDDDADMAIEKLRNTPSVLMSFNVDSYANDRSSKIETLRAIKLELIQGFQDWRRPYEEPNQDEEFYMISGETDDTLGVGRTVQATVRRVQTQRAICSLESGLTGMLAKEDYCNDWRDSDLTEKLQEGQVLECKIKSVLKNRYQVFLTCREDDMRNNGQQNVDKQDTYYHEDRSSLESEQLKARKGKECAKKHFKPRMIVHPHFQNMSADEAMEFLADKEVGQSIIRPSSRGPSYLTLTLKVYDGVYAHKDIIEGGKERKDVTSYLRIGKTLKIGDGTFEDLDEVMDRYVDPLVTNLKAMLNYRKFRKGTKAEVDELLRAEKAENPMRIVYSLGISHEHPGTFILTYIRGSSPHHEYIGVYPNGFKFRSTLFEVIDRLIAYFQKHINDDPLQKTPSIRSVSAVVPMRGPAPRGASGGGWGGSNGNDGVRRGSSDRDRSTPRTGQVEDRNGSRHGTHPSGAPRPYEDRGHVRGSYQGNRDGGSKWGSSYKDGNSNRGSFLGAEVQNNPREEAVSSGWEGSGRTSGGQARNDDSGWGGSKSSSMRWGDSGGGR